MPHDNEPPQKSAQTAENISATALADRLENSQFYSTSQFIRQAAIALRKQEQRIKTLIAENERTKQMLSTKSFEMGVIQGEQRSYRNALSFYAKPATYQPTGPVSLGKSPIRDDKGRRARNALEDGDG